VGHRRNWWWAGFLVLGDSRIVVSRNALWALLSDWVFRVCWYWLGGNRCPTWLIKRFSFGCWVVLGGFGVGRLVGGGSFAGFLVG